MKILFFISSLGNGGAERVASVLLNTFAESGHDLNAVLLADNLIYYAVSDKVRITFMESEWKKKHNKAARVAERIRLIRHMVKSEKPDIVISFISETNLDVSTALLFTDTPLIVSERSDPKINPGSRMKRVMRRVLYHRPDGFVFQTEDARDYFGNSIRKKSVVILNPLVSGLPDVFTGERDKRVVSVARLSKPKNLPLLLEAFKGFVKVKPEFCLEIYGEGDQEKQIRRLIEEMGLFDYVKLPGFCKDVHERINRAAMFVMSSDYEGLPNALMEAMAQGLPCISTDCPCGGPRNLIENRKNGLLVKVGDAEGLTEAMINILDDPACRGLGERAAELRITANAHAIAEQWIGYINNVIERGHYD